MPPPLPSNELLNSAKTVLQNVYSNVNLYFYTVTLSPKLYKLASKEQFMQTSFIIRNTIHKYARHYGIMPEITKDGNVHYHFWATIKNEENRFILLNELKRKQKLGFIKLTPNKVDTPESLDRMLNYIFKEHEKTHKILLMRNHESIYYSNINEQYVNETPDEQPSNLILKIISDLDYKGIQIELIKK